MSIPNQKLLATMTAVDLMARDVVVIPVGTSMRAAAHLLAEARISGAPVVDAEGRCLGVLSAADFFRGWVNENLEMDPTDTVGEHMRANPTSAVGRKCRRFFGPSLT